MKRGEEVRWKVAFQGEPGAYSEEAVVKVFGEAGSPVPRRKFREVGRAVAEGSVDFGLLPIENSLAGSVVKSYDVLAGEDLRVLGEVAAPIRHCLLALPEAEMDDLRRVLSHPVALAQCVEFFEAHPELEAVAAYDTAGAAATVLEDGDPRTAAIASRAAADRYRLRVLATDLQDRDDNQTRFYVVARPGRELPGGAGGGAPPEGFRTALLLETENVPGALLRVLEPLAEEGINLSKLESRPGEEPWTYRFFVEVEAHADEEGARRAFSRLEGRTESFRLLGSFPVWGRPG